MQSMLHLHGSYGLPLSVSGITHHFMISKEMADHDLRREAMKRQRSQHLLADQQMGVGGNNENGLQEIREAVVDGDLAGVLHDLVSGSLLCIAKAA